MMKRERGRRGEKTRNSRKRSSLLHLLAPTLAALCLWISLHGTTAAGQTAPLSGVRGLRIARSSPQKIEVEAGRPVDTANRPELVLQTGHSRKVEAIAFSSDELLLASGGVESVIKLWDVGLGRELRTLAGHAGGVRALAFSPRADRLASGGLDGKIRIWDVASGRELRLLDAHSGPLNAIAVSRDGRYLASGGADTTIRIWDASTWREVRTLTGHHGWILGLAISPDGRWLASASADQTIRLWDLTGREDPQMLTGHTAGVKSVAFSPDGETLASGGFDKSVRLWKVSRARLIKNLPEHGENILTIAFTQSAPGASAVLAAGSIDREVRQTGGENWRDLEVISKPQGADRYYALAFSPRGNWFASSIGDQRIELRALKGGRITRRLETISNPVLAAAASRDGRWFAAAHRDNSIRLWDLLAGREVQSLNGRDGSVTALAFSPNSEWLVSGSIGGMVAAWEITSGRQAGAAKAHDAGVNSVVFTSDGTLIITASADGTIGVFKAAGLEPVNRLTPRTGEVMSLALSPDDSVLVSGGADGRMILWQTSDWMQHRVITGHAGPVFTVAFSRDGSRLASGGADGTIRLQDLSSRNTPRVVRGHQGFVNAVAFSPDGALLVSGSERGEVRGWDPSAGAEVMAAPSAHSGAVRSIVFNPQGRWFATGSDDGSTRIWSVATGQEWATLISLRASRDWLVATPGGLFDGSSAVAWGQVIWRFGGDTFKTAPVEAFFNEYFHPDLLAEVLAGKEPRPEHDITRIDRRQPEIELLAPDAATASKSGRVRIQIRVGEAAADAENPRPGGARDVRLFRNGQLVKAWRGGLARLPLTLTADVALAGGENRFTAYAFNSHNVKSRDAMLTVAGSEEAKSKGTLYLINIGINKYANEAFNLQAAVADARDFNAALVEAQQSADRYARIESVFLLDEDATRANIVAAIKRLTAGGSEPSPPALARLRAVGPQDAVVIFFAGHGTAQGKRFYLVPHDLGYEGPRAEIDERGVDELLGRSISDLELERLFEDVDAGSLLFVIDACNSGKVLEADERRRGPMNSQGLAQLAYEKGMYILTAAQSYQAAYEHLELGHGYLTYALVEDGLRKMEADRSPRDARIELREWFDYAAEQVPRMQETKLKKDRGLLVRAEAPAAREVQRPRVFYRREPETDPFVVVRRSAPASPK